ncbi:MAG TPA: NAD(+)/NADH kinase [Gaiellales bacterium]|nr:NAD(+)/NADH kinase [Gaiellales bacterium]
MAIGRAAYLTHGRAEVIGDALDRMRAVAARAGVEIVEDGEVEPDLVVVLGGDGTMLRALQRWLGTGVPSLGVNFGRVGFLTSASGAELESGLEAAFAGRYRVFDLPTLVGDAGTGPLPGVNDIVLTSATPGRMAVIQWSVDGQSLGELGCDGVIAATPTGSTAYNLSAGGPVLVPGTDGYVVTFVSPHALNARSMVLGRPHTVIFSNAAADVPVQAIVDGHVVAVVDPGGRVEVRMGHTSAALARISGTSFFTRYLQEFSH